MNGADIEAMIIRIRNIFEPLILYDAKKYANGVPTARDSIVAKNILNPTSQICYIRDAKRTTATEVVDLTE